MSKSIIWLPSPMSIQSIFRLLGGVCPSKAYYSEFSARWLGRLPSNPPNQSRENEQSVLQFSKSRDLTAKACVFGFKFTTQNGAVSYLLSRGIILCNYGLMKASTTPLTATMPDIRAGANRFVTDWRNESRERAEKDTFWNEFFGIFGINRYRVGAVFEQVAKRYSTGNTGFLDLLWSKKIGVEHKSFGGDLTAAMNQLIDYLPGVRDEDLPRLLVVCDFQNFVVRDLEKGTEHKFTLDELPQHLELFTFLAGYDHHGVLTEEKANLVATGLLRDLHDLLKEIRYPDEQTQKFLVRLLYALFADSTGVWPRGMFADYVNVHTALDGEDLGTRLNRLFEVLDTPEDERPNNLGPTLSAFPYVNGGLFNGRLRYWPGTPEMREAVMEACAFEWSRISPVIFGSLFQNVTTPVERRHLGAHFTSERDIMRAIRPLFLDELEAELGQAKGLSLTTRRRRLNEFHDKLGSLTFLDPAAGVGNFLLLTFRELRRLEQETLLALREADTRVGRGDMVLDIDHLVKVTPNQFYGIEIESFPARIGETAMHLVDHIANMELGVALGAYFVRLPIADTASFTVGDALTIDWKTVVQGVSFIIGNPPFVGRRMRDPEQTEGLKNVWGKDYHGGLDFVTAWHRKSADYFKVSPDTRTVLVSTNSIVQGDHVTPMWKPLFEDGVVIDFAHRTFAWVSEASGAAAVHVVIIGFSLGGYGTKRIFEYSNATGEPIEVAASNINAYLADAPNAFVASRRKSLSVDLPRVTNGNRPTDGGHLIVEADEVAEVRQDPIAAKYLRRFIGAAELLHNRDRWCLWMVDLEPGDLSRSPVLTKRVRAVEAVRARSPQQAVREHGRPTLFERRPQPNEKYLAIPRVVSENREYLTAGHFDPEVITSDLNYMAVDPEGIAFAVISSRMFIVWQRAVGGRLKSDLRFSNLLAWNNFPMRKLTPSERSVLASAGKDVLAAREKYPNSSLAQLYEQGGIPTALHETHRGLDRIVDKLIGGRARITNDEDRLRVLFRRYAELTV